MLGKTKPRRFGLPPREAAQGPFRGLLPDRSRNGSLSERQIRLALAYYGRFPEEIDEAIALQRRPLAQLRTEYPFIEVHLQGERRAGAFRVRVAELRPK